MLLGFELTIREILRVETVESTKEFRNPVFLRVEILLIVALIIHSILQKK